MVSGTFGDIRGLSFLMPNAEIQRTPWASGWTDLLRGSANERSHQRTTGVEEAARMAWL